MLHLIGVISDTHGLLRPQAIAALRGALQGSSRSPASGGASLIIHAGDVGKPQILDELEKIAPVKAVRGNVDQGPWALKLPMTQTIAIGEARLHVIHILADLKIDPVADEIAVVISGHSHAPAITHSDGVLYLNPGSAGPRRFNLPVSLAMLTVDDQNVRAELVELSV